MAKAELVVKDAPADRVPAVLRAVVAAAAGDAAAVEALMAECVKGGGNHCWFWYDEDFARLVAGEAFDAVRKKYPDPRPKTPGPVG